jgi:hypothetical protein
VDQEAPENCRGRCTIGDSFADGRSGVEQSETRRDDFNMRLDSDAPRAAREARVV